MIRKLKERLTIILVKHVLLYKKIESPEHTQVPIIYAPSESLTFHTVFRSTKVYTMRSIVYIISIMYMVLTTWEQAVCSLSPDYIEITLMFSELLAIR